MEAEVVILDMLASVINKHQLVEEEKSILEVIEIDAAVHEENDDIDEGVDVGVDMEANIGDHGDEGFDGVDIPGEIVDMATRIRDLDICKTFDDNYIFCDIISYVTIDTIHGGMETLCAMCFRLNALRHRDPGAMYTHVDVHCTRAYSEMQRHYCRVCERGIFFMRPIDVCTKCNIT
ncbi:hypothetical protein JTB14_031525 [Gonioctena quinquepunctata]|nr:hypothetical protein JTB14_031525 [Gonioctena quinquepunctata]